jgi:hypothetical protein
MAGGSFLAVACAGLIGILFGLALAFAGYRFFLILLPIFGFFFGLAFGAHTVQMLFGQAFLATVTSWVVGFIVALAFAVLSYLFYFIAVALIAGALGYAVVVGLVQAIGLPMGWLLWIIGVAAGIAVAIVTLRFNLQKWVVIVGTAVLGAGTIIGTFILMFYPSADVLQNPVRYVISNNWFMALLFIVIAVLGIVVQARSGRSYTVAEYNRWESEAPS